MGGIGSGMGQIADGVKSVGGLFGKFNPDATNDVLNGQVVATGTPGAQTVADPRGGLTTGNMIARGLTGAGLGAMQGMGQQQIPQGGGGMMQMQTPQQPQLDAAAYGQMPKMNPWFYGSR